MDGEDGGGVRDSTFHAGGRVAAHVVVDAADNDGGAVGAAARAFLLKLSAPEIPRRSLAHGRAESKKAIGPRGKKEGREGGEGGGGGGGRGTAISPPPPSPHSPPRPPPTMTTPRKKRRRRHTRTHLPPSVRPWPPPPPSSSRAPSDVARPSAAHDDDGDTSKAHVDGDDGGEIERRRSDGRTEGRTDGGSEGGTGDGSVRFCQSRNTVKCVLGR